MFLFDKNRDSNRNIKLDSLFTLNKKLFFLIKLFFFWKEGWVYNGSSIGDFLKNEYFFTLKRNNNLKKNKLFSIELIL